MNKAKLIVIAGFLVAFGAGVVTGMLTHRTTVEPPKGPRSRPKPFAELKLTPAQEKQMEGIWSGVMKRGRDHDEQTWKLRRERSEAIAALMTAPELKAKYDAIQKNYNDKLAAMDQDRKKLFDAAVTQTKLILTEEQRKKYEEMHKRREADGRGRGPGPRPEERATSRPAN